MIKLLLKHPLNWMESFEDYSLRVKKEGFSLENINVNDNNSRLKENYKEIKEYGEKASKILIGKVKDTQEGDEGEEGGGEEEEMPPA